MYGMACTWVHFNKSMICTVICTFQSIQINSAMLVRLAQVWGYGVSLNWLGLCLHSLYSAHECTNNSVYLLMAVSRHTNAPEYSLMCGAHPKGTCRLLLIAHLVLSLLLVLRVQGWAFWWAWVLGLSPAFCVGKK